MDLEGFSEGTRLPPEVPFIDGWLFLVAALTILDGPGSADLRIGVSWH